MKSRIIRIILCLIIFSIPCVGIWWGTQIFHNTIGFIVGLICSFLLLPCSGVLFDAFTNDKILDINIDTMKVHLTKRDNDIK